MLKKFPCFFTKTENWEGELFFEFLCTTTTGWLLLPQTVLFPSKLHQPFPKQTSSLLCLATWKNYAVRRQRLSSGVLIAFFRQLSNKKLNHVGPEGKELFFVAGDVMRTSSRLVRRHILFTLHQATKRAFFTVFWLVTHFLESDSAADRPEGKTIFSRVYVSDDVL